MAKAHLKQRIDTEVLKLVDDIVKELTEQTKVEIGEGAVVERAIKELHAKMFPTEKKK